MDWIPALTTTGVAGLLLTAAGWLARNVISERLKNAVRFEFDAKLEQVRAEIRSSEAHLQAVRSTALAALTNSQTGLNERRFKAIEDLWAATMSYKAGSTVVKVVGKLKLDKLSKPDASIQKLVSMFEPFQQAFVTGGADAKKAESARPFVSPMAWALFTAYNSIVLQAVLQFNALKNGDDPMKFVNTARTLELVKTALPEFAELLEEHREAAYPELLPDIEERLLSELRATAGGREWDQQNVERAKKVAHLAALQAADAKPM
jgi:hypothetical protein